VKRITVKRKLQIRKKRFGQKVRRRGCRRIAAIHSQVNNNKHSCSESKTQRTSTFFYRHFQLESRPYSSLFQDIDIPNQHGQKPCNEDDGNISSLEGGEQELAKGVAMLLHSEQIQVLISLLKVSIAESEQRNPA
jgi:hypothetical protein